MRNVLLLSEIIKICETCYYYFFVNIMMFAKRGAHVCGGVGAHLYASACSALIRSLCTCAKQPSSRWCAGATTIAGRWARGHTMPAVGGQVARIGLLLTRAFEMERWSGRAGQALPDQWWGRYYYTKGFFTHSSASFCGTAYAYGRFYTQRPGRDAPAARLGERGEAGRAGRPS